MKPKNIFAMAMAGLFIATTLSCSKSDKVEAPPGGSTVTINIVDLSFSLSTATVKKGATVKWLNKDPTAHTVTSDDGVSFNSGNIAEGRTFSFTTNKVGTFPYHCSIHTSMKATLIVTQ